MVESRDTNRIFDRHAEVEHVYNDLEYGRENGRATRRAEDDFDLAIPKQYSR